MSLHCPKCDSERSSVVDSRSDGSSIRRRRECGECDLRFTTYERVELALPMVVKKDDRREPFKRSKIRVGLIRACEKRPVSVEIIDQVVDRIEKRVHELCEKELPSRQVGQFLMEELKGLDKIAYIRFASVYEEFSDVKDFKNALSNLDETKQNIARVK